jgi:hypothetical protein
LTLPSITVSSFLIAGFEDFAAKNQQLHKLQNTNPYTTWNVTSKEKNRGRCGVIKKFNNKAYV